MPRARALLVVASAVALVACAATYTVEPSDDAGAPALDAGVDATVVLPDAGGAKDGGSVDVAVDEPKSPPDGAALDGVSGTNYVRGMLDWNLPALRFRRAGTLALYASWARLSIFGGGLATNLDDAASGRHRLHHAQHLDGDAALDRFLLLGRTDERRRRRRRRNGRLDGLREHDPRRRRGRGLRLRRLRRPLAREDLVVPRDEGVELLPHRFPQRPVGRVRDVLVLDRVVDVRVGRVQALQRGLNVGLRDRHVRLVERRVRLVHELLRERLQRAEPNHLRTKRPRRLDAASDGRKLATDHALHRVTSGGALRG